MTHAALPPTEDNIEGPYFRPNAPFRTQVSPPNQSDNAIVISGRVLGFDTQKPIPNAQIDIWQADAQGVYDNDFFQFRARMLSNNRGDYLFRSVFPGQYDMGNSKRPSHIHYRVKAYGYEELTTQLYFRGDPYNAVDPFIKDSLIIDMRTGEDHSVGKFDIVLVPE